MNLLIVPPAFRLPMVGCALPRDRRRFHYLDCLFFSTPSDPDGVLFVRKSDNTFLLYRLCDRQFHEHEWKGSVVASNTIFHEGKLYTFSFEKERKRKLNALIDEDWSWNDENWSLAVVSTLSFQVTLLQ